MENILNDPLAGENCWQCHEKFKQNVPTMPFSYNYEKAAPCTKCHAVYCIWCVGSMYWNYNKETIDCPKCHAIGPVNWRELQAHFWKLSQYLTADKDLALKRIKNERNRLMIRNDELSTRLKQSLENYKTLSLEFESQEETLRAKIEEEIQEKAEVIANEVITDYKRKYSVILADRPLGTAKKAKTPKRVTFKPEPTPPVKVLELDSSETPPDREPEDPLSLNTSEYLDF